MGLQRLLGVAALGMLSAFAPGCVDGEEEGAAQESDLTAGERPPQFVLLAFDGSKSLSFWNESRAFAAANDVKFTYFISGVYFLANENKSAYQAPHHSAGRSNIGFGGTLDDVRARLEQLELAYQEGHEIASHANGHYDGSSWSQEDWENEYAQFNELIFNASAMNGADLPALSFDASVIRGFRAPMLGHSPGMNQAVANSGMTYDTSRSREPTYWPRRFQSGTWNFPLAQLRIVGSNKRTLSMDYNFYYADSKAKRDSANKETYRQQMVDTYMKYFEGNYFGNRAPIHIGHHFSKWNGGAYWEAMQQFAQKVCGLPEVKCSTYVDLVDFLEENEELVAGFQAGDFPKMARPPGVDDIGFEDEEPIPDDQLEENGLVADSSGQHDHEDGEHE